MADDRIDEARPPARAALKTILRALQPAGPVATQLFGQVISLLSQAAMLKVFGTGIYGSIGLALVTASTLAFVGELGYPPLLLREAATGGWQDLWPVAVFHRLTALALSAGAAVVIWIAIFGADAPGTSFMMAAAPGLVLSALNPVPVLYGLGRVRTAAGVTYLRWISQGIAMTLVLVLADDRSAGLGAGLAFSAGFAAQSAVLPILGYGLRPWLPHMRLSAGSQTRGAFAMWSMSLAGAVNDRFLPFLIKGTRPDLLAHALLITQVLQGLSGLAGQLDRLLVPWLSVIRGTGSWKRELMLVQSVTLAVSMLAAGALVVAAAVAVEGGLVRIGEVGPLSLLLLEWGVTIGGLTFTAAVLATVRERTYARWLVTIIAISVGLQIAVAGVSGSFTGVMIIRIAVALLAVAIPLRLVGGVLPRGSVTSLFVVGLFAVAMVYRPDTGTLIAMSVALTVFGIVQAVFAARRILAG